jgi:hypothetical protein
MEDFKTMAEVAIQGVEDARKHLVYCDYIAYLIQNNLKCEDLKDMSLLASVGTAQMDMDADGSFRSTKRTIGVTDRQGKKYTITVEAA